MITYFGCTFISEFCGIGLCEVMIQLEQILCLYQDFQPTLLAEHPTILGNYSKYFI
jgi:hypothetical protein